MKKLFILVMILTLSSCMVSKKTFDENVAKWKHRSKNLKVKPMEWK